MLMLVVLWQIMLMLYIFVTNNYIHWRYISNHAEFKGVGRKAMLIYLVHFAVASAVGVTTIGGSHKDCNNKAEV